MKYRLSIDTVSVQFGQEFETRIGALLELTKMYDLRLVEENLDDLLAYKTVRLGSGDKVSITPLD